MQEISETLGWEDPLKEKMATHSRFLPGESHGQSKQVESEGCEESDMTEMTEHACSMLGIVKTSTIKCLTYAMFIPFAPDSSMR